MYIITKYYVHIMHVCNINIQYDNFSVLLRLEPWRAERVSTDTWCSGEMDSSHL